MNAIVVKKSTKWYWIIAEMHFKKCTITHVHRKLEDEKLCENGRRVCSIIKTMHLFKLTIPMAKMNELK